MFDAFFDTIAAVLAWFYALWPSYGMAIILLTVAVMIVLTPLTLKSTRSMIRMQQVQPELKRLQKEYKDDRQKLNEELLKFYKENQINPLGGCLPLLLQMPVFIILFQVLRGLTRRGDDGTFDPKYLDQSTELYQDLSASTEMVSWGIDLAKSASDALEASFLTAIPYFLMIAFVALTSYIQQKQVSGRNPGAEMSSQQRMLLRIMPAFLAFISFGFQAALVVYFIASNVYRMGQQAYITRTMYRKKDGKDDDGPIDTTATEVGNGRWSVKGLLGVGGGAAADAGGDGAAEETAAPGPRDPKPRGPREPAAKGGKGGKGQKRSGKGSSNGRGSSSKSGGSRSRSGKGSNKRTTAPRSVAGRSLPQPKPRKKKRK